MGRRRSRGAPRAAGLVWDYAEATGNERWKGLTWGMLPLHASGAARPSSY